jgi:hypothetical protein
MSAYKLHCADTVISDCFIEQVGCVVWKGQPMSQLAWEYFNALDPEMCGEIYAMAFREDLEEEEYGY